MVGVLMSPLKSLGNSPAAGEENDEDTEMPSMPGSPDLARAKIFEMRPNKPIVSRSVS